MRGEVGSALKFNKIREREGGRGERRVRTKVRGEKRRKRKRQATLFRTLLYKMSFELNLLCLLVLYLIHVGPILSNNTFKTTLHCYVSLHAQMFAIYI